MAMPNGIEFKKQDEFPKVLIIGIYKYKMFVGNAIGYKKRDGTVCVYPKKLTVPGVFPKDMKIPIRVRYDDVPWVKFLEG